MPVELTSRRRRRGVRSAAVRADARRLLYELGLRAELSIALVGDAEMQSLNARYRSKDRPTDVLAFPLEAHIARKEAKHAAPDGTRPEALLGDVVIALDSAARQAAERGIPIADEVRTLLTHGVLHLIGYDHERSPAEARRMFAKQRRLIATLKTGP